MESGVPGFPKNSVPVNILVYIVYKVWIYSKSKLITYSDVLLNQTLFHSTKQHIHVHSNSRYRFFGEIRVFDGVR